MFALIEGTGMLLGIFSTKEHMKVVIDTTDTMPYGCFWLRTTSVLKKDELDESLKGLIDNIKYWFNDEFDNYFSINK